MSICHGLIIESNKPLAKSSRLPKLNVWSRPGIYGSRNVYQTSDVNFTLRGKIIHARRSKKRVRKIECKLTCQRVGLTELEPPQSTSHRQIFPLNTKSLFPTNTYEKKEENTCLGNK